MFCPSCGSAVEVDARFCRNCGHVLRTDDAETQTPESPPSTPSAPPPSPPSGQPFEPYPTSYPPPSTGAPTYGQFGGGLGGPLAPFGQPLATWWQRVGSMVIDWLVVAVPLLIVAGAIDHHTNSVSMTTSSSHTSWVTVIFAVLGVLYFGTLNGTGQGQTVGNRAPGIAVRDANSGATIGFGRGVLRAFVRILLYSAFFIPGLLNDLWPLWDSKRQSIADKAARSIVVRVR